MGVEVRQRGRKMDCCLATSSLENEELAGNGGSTGVGAFVAQILGKSPGLIS